MKHFRPIRMDAIHTRSALLMPSISFRMSYRSSKLLSESAFPSYRIRTKLPEALQAAIHSIPSIRNNPFLPYAFL